MKYVATTALKKILGLKKRIKIVQGGSSAGKTIAILMVLIDIAQREKNLLISVVSETMPHLRRGAYRDFLNIMEAHGYYEEACLNKTELIYTLPGTGSRIEFFSADQPGKVRGPRRDILFINEANGLDYETYTQLAIRTNLSIFIDYNPTSSFWVHDEIIPSQEHDFLIITYKDNEGLPESIVKELESRKGNKRFWTVYGEGKVGEVGGRIYTGWEILDEIPFEARLFRRGLDFGYSQDPTAIVDIYQWNGAYVLDEVFYEKFQSNRKIADFLLNQEYPALTIADSAEPKSIDELKGYGVNVIAAQKGPGSVQQGIQFMQDQKIFITKNSVNGIREYRNYVWKEDRDGRILDVPDDGQEDHFLDAARYGFNGKVEAERKAVAQSRSQLAPYGQRPRAR